MKIQVKKYKLDISKSADLETYTLLVETLKSKGLEKWHVLMSEYVYKWNDAKNFYESIQEVEKVDTNFVFTDQLNTMPIGDEKGKRLHFWSEFKYPNKKIKEGYYIEDLTEYTNLLDQKVCCGYCGSQQFKYEVKEDFCTKCLGSEYLNKDTLHLTVLRPVKSKNNPKVNNDVLHNITLEHEKQFAIRRKALIKKRISDIENGVKTEIDKFTRHTEISADLKIQLLKLGYIQDNIIFYHHDNTVKLNWTNSSSNEFTKDEIIHIKENLVLPEQVEFR